MALPRWLAQVNLRFSNVFMRPIAARLPWFVVLEHVGRKSGTVRRTAIMAFHRKPSSMPWLVRPFLAVLGVSEFLELREKG